VIIGPKVQNLATVMESTMRTSGNRIPISFDGGADELEVRDRLLRQRVERGARADRFMRSQSHRGFGLMRKKNEAPDNQYAHRDWVYFDAFTVAAGAAFPATVMFSVPQGSGGKVLATSNLQGQGGQLPAGEILTITSIRLYISNLTVPADLQNIITNVSVQFKVRNYPIFQCTPEFLPPGNGGITISQAQLGTAPTGSAASVSTSNGQPTQGSVYTFNIPYKLGMLENFQILLNPDNAFNMTAATGTNPLGVGTTIKCYLEGVRDILLAG
jgi:hypothetical protein